VQADPASTIQPVAAIEIVELPEKSYGEPAFETASASVPVPSDPGWNRFPTQAVL
jgi:hypothetical protein